MPLPDRAADWEKAAPRPLFEHLKPADTRRG